MPATGGSTQEAWEFIKELCMRNRGEVRELRGHWEECDGPLPIEMLNPQFNGSFIRVSGEMAMQGGKLAAGSWQRMGHVRCWMQVDGPQSCSIAWASTWMSRTKGRPLAARQWQDRRCFFQ